MMLVLLSRKLEPEFEVNNGVLVEEVFERGNVVKIPAFIEKQRGLFCAGRFPRRTGPLRSQ
jgi:hypothetical protein